MTTNLRHYQEQNAVADKWIWCERLHLRSFGHCFFLSGKRDEVRDHPREEEAVGFVGALYVGRILK